jgi:uncharacterized protein (UPF0248 family)
LVGLLHKKLGMFTSKELINRVQYYQPLQIKKFSYRSLHEGRTTNLTQMSITELNMALIPVVVYCY